MNLIWLTGERVLCSAEALLCSGSWSPAKKARTERYLKSIQSWQTFQKPANLSKVFKRPLLQIYKSRHFFFKFFPTALRYNTSAHFVMASTYLNPPLSCFTMAMNSVGNSVSQKALFIVNRISIDVTFDDR